MENCRVIALTCLSPRRVIDSELANAVIYSVYDDSEWDGRFFEQAPRTLCSSPGERREKIISKVMRLINRMISLN